MLRINRTLKYGLADDTCYTAVQFNIGSLPIINHFLTAATCEHKRVIHVQSFMFNSILGVLRRCGKTRIRVSLILLSIPYLTEAFRAYRCVCPPSWCLCFRHLFNSQVSIPYLVDGNTTICMQVRPCSNCFCFCFLCSIQLSNSVARRRREQRMIA